MSESWEKKVETEIKEGRFFRTIEAKRHTFSELIDRYLQTGMPRKGALNSEEAFAVCVVGVILKRHPLVNQTSLNFNQNYLIFGQIPRYLTNFLEKHVYF